MRVGRRLAGMAWLISLLVGLGGCAVFHGQYQPVPVLSEANPAPTGNYIVGTMVPAGDYHLVTVRPQPANNTPIFCTEPSPDWATAFGSTLAATLAGGGTHGANANVTESSTETITALLGRTAGVVALRDGLYSACQAYANGIIGKAAYALIISQYGDLLTNLAGSGAGGGSSGPAAGTPAGGTPAASTPSAGNSQVQVLQQQVLQAMMVSCITNSDPTQDHPNNVRAADGTLFAGFNADGSPNEQTYKTTNLVPAADQNQLLHDECPGFFGALAKALPTIIAEGAASGANGGKPGVQTGGKAPAAGVKAPPSAEVMALQKNLVADGDFKGTVDGLIGPQTEAALTLYVAKHPAALPAPH